MWLEKAREVHGGWSGHIGWWIMEWGLMGPTKALSFVKLNKVTFISPFNHSLSKILTIRWPKLNGG